MIPWPCFTSIFLLDTRKINEYNLPPPRSHRHPRPRNLNLAMNKTCHAKNWQWPTLGLAMTETYILPEKLRISGNCVDWKKSPVSQHVCCACQHWNWRGRLDWWNYKSGIGAAPNVLSTIQYGISSTLLLPFVAPEETLIPTPDNNHPRWRRSEPFDQWIPWTIASWNTNPSGWSSKACCCSNHAMFSWRILSYNSLA